MDFDVLIAGSGPAACAAAITLAQHSDFRTAISEWTFPGARSAVGESAPHSLCNLTDYLGMWETLRERSIVAPSEMLTSWGSAELTRGPINPGQSLSRLTLQRPQFDLCLKERAFALGVEFITASSTSLPQLVGNGHWILKSESAGSGEIKAKWLIDATGKTRRAIRKQSKRITCDRLAGAVCLLPQSFAGAGIGCTVMESVEHGWWYAALLPGGTSVVSFMSDPDILHDLGMSTRAGWSAGLEQTRHLSTFLSLPAAMNPRIHSAASQVTVPQTHESWIAVGEAAAAFDPLSSMGINFALQSGIEGARAAASGLTGSNVAVQQYWASVNHIFAEYSASRDVYYASERRWSRSRFWSRRLVGVAEERQNWLN